MIIKCKMCGGDLHPENEKTTCECEFCGTVQTIPTDDGEKKTNLFNRANHLRMNAEFDKAATVYESIVAEFPSEAEAYWGLCLCAYGIEYVDDPTTGEKMPTCHRTLTSSIMEDTNFEQACDYADSVARRVYREEAKAIDRIQQEILSIVSSEEPYDVFICYKETADEGGRTEDSVLAQDIYDSLKDKGLKVFFSRISLEDKLGQQYEPYIYAALSSAKIMLAIGTKFEYFDAVWVKNEWMRFLSMMKTDKRKVLIPCYKDLDAYDMPKEFKNLQAQDMGKLGWLQDLVRGVEKLIGKNNKSIEETPSRERSQVDIYIKRSMVFLENGEWESANEYCEKALDLNPENPQAYVVKELIDRKCNGIDELAKFLYFERPEESNNLRMARRYADKGDHGFLDELGAKVKSITEDQKCDFEKKVNKVKSLPNWQEKKAKLEYVRERAEILSERIAQEGLVTIILNTDGELLCTRHTNENFRRFYGDMAACGTWKSRFYSFMTDTSVVYGCEINGKILKTKERYDSKAIDPNDFFAKQAYKWPYISKWGKVKYIKTESMGGNIYGIMEDDTVKVGGESMYNDCGQTNVDNLRNIKSMICFDTTLGRTIFLGNDGKTRSTERTGEDPYFDVWEDMSEWNEIKKVIYLGKRYIGVKYDGTSVATRYFGEDNEKSCVRETESWSNIVQCIRLQDRILGLSDTGKPVVTNYYGDKEENPKLQQALREVCEWEDIAVLYGGWVQGLILGLTIAGTVKKSTYFGDESNKDRSDSMIDSWTDIAALLIGFKGIIAVKMDGSMVSAGKDSTGETAVSDFRMFRDYNNIQREIEEGILAEKKRQQEEINRQKEEAQRREELRRQEERKQREEKERRSMELQSEKTELTNELNNLRGIFSGRRKKEIQNRLYMIEHELNHMNK